MKTFSSLMMKSAAPKIACASALMTLASTSVFGATMTDIEHAVSLAKDGVINDR